MFSLGPSAPFLFSKLEILFILLNAGIAQPLDPVSIIGQVITGLIGIWNKVSLANAKSLFAKQFAKLENRLYEIEKKELSLSQIEKAIEDEVDSQLAVINNQLALFRDGQKHQSEINSKLFDKLETLIIGVSKLQESNEFIKNRMRNGRK